MPTKKNGVCDEVQRTIVRIAEGDLTLTNNEIVKAAVHSAICDACTNFINELSKKIPEEEKTTEKEKSNGRGGNLRVILH